MPTAMVYRWECTLPYLRDYRIVGIFRGGNFSWMLKLLLARGKNFVLEPSLVTV